MTSVLSALVDTRNFLLKGSFAAIDTEYQINHNNEEKPFTLFAACVIDNDMKAEAKHLADFSQFPQPEKELVIWLMNKMAQYQLTLGWYSRGVNRMRENGTLVGKDSDLVVIDSVCRYYKIPSIVGFTMAGPYVAGYPRNKNRLNKFSWYYHIDLYKIYEKPVVRTIIYHNRYKSLGLNSVCLAILGEGKLEGLSGAAIQTLPKKQQLEYVSQDARLVMKLVQNDNYRILDLMNAIALITSISFEKVCHSGIHTWWSKMLEKKIESGECRKPPALDVRKREYAGGLVLEPKKGYYEKQRVYVLDVKSLYPSMMINHNISFDTVNCDCCKNNESAKVSSEIMNLINENTSERRDQYWICKDKNYRGIVPKMLKNYRDERFRQREIGNDTTQLALKNIINGCYGLFGSKDFPYADYRVAEITTAFGRQTLNHMQLIAREVYGFDVIYGDTDSIFVTNVLAENDIKKFIAECKILRDIEVEVSETYGKFLIIKKKHYIGIPVDENKRPDIKGMEGIKSDRPSWINKIQRQLVDDIKNGANPILRIRNAYNEMVGGKVPLEELRINLTLTNYPSHYKNNSLQKLLGSKLNATIGDTISYYKSECQGAATINPRFISRKKYLQLLRSSLDETLKLMGYDYLRDILGYRNIQDFNE